ncbi:hypothetical protein ACOBV8_18475 (plasmid) [Pseudoalteromonas espejiana]
MHKAANTLSVGQQQRVAIARALNKLNIHRTAKHLSIRRASRDAFMTLLIDLCKQHSTTLVFVSHDMHLQQFF